MMVLIGRNILSLFVSGEPEQIRRVLDIAYKYLFIRPFCGVGILQYGCGHGGGP